MRFARIINDEDLKTPPETLAGAARSAPDRRRQAAPIGAPLPSPFFPCAKTPRITLFRRRTPSSSEDAAPATSARRCVLARTSNSRSRRRCSGRALHGLGFRWVRVRVSAAESCCCSRTSSELVRSPPPSITVHAVRKSPPRSCRRRGRDHARIHVAG